MCLGAYISQQQSRNKHNSLLQADIMANVEALLADTQALLARLQEGESGGADDETFFAADPARSISLHSAPA